MTPREKTNLPAISPAPPHPHRPATPDSTSLPTPTPQTRSATPATQPPGYHKKQCLPAREDLAPHQAPTAAPKSPASADQTSRSQASPGFAPHPPPPLPLPLRRPSALCGSTGIATPDTPEDDAPASCLLQASAED